VQERSTFREEHRERTWNAAVFGSAGLVASLPYNSLGTSERLLLPQGPSSEIPVGALQEFNPLPWNSLNPDKRQWQLQWQWVENFARVLAPSDATRQVLSVLILLAVRNTRNASLAVILAVVENPGERARFIQRVSQSEGKAADPGIAMLQLLESPEVKSDLIAALSPFRSSYWRLSRRVETSNLIGSNYAGQAAIIITTPGNPAAEASAQIVGRLMQTGLELRDAHSSPMLLILELRDALSCFDLPTLFASLSQSKTLLVLVANDLTTVPAETRARLLRGLLRLSRFGLRFGLSRFGFRISIVSQAA
jgi:hypothetical protein